LLSLVIGYGVISSFRFDETRQINLSYFILLDFAIKIEHKKINH